VPPVRLAVSGDFVAENSFARVNRGIFGALAARGDVELAVLAEPTVAPIAGGPNDAALQAARAVRFVEGADVTVRHTWPAVFARPRRGAYVHIQPWEFGSLPKTWAEQASALADEVWCYSTYVAQTYGAAGVEPERVHVVPLGYDPAIFHPREAAPARRPFGERCVFLFVGDTIARKGADVAVDAYVTAFGPSDDVVLVVKDFGSKGAGEDSVRERILALSRRADVAPIVYLEAYYTDAALADLYRAARALLAPYRSEGFGLPILEAMACGTAVVTTRGGAPDDFVSDDAAYRIDATVKPLGRRVGGVELVGDGFVLEPNEGELVERLRFLYEHPAEARRVGAQASAAVGGWTWERSAARAAERLTALAAGGRTSAPDSDALNRFEWSVASPGGEDGILVEIFRRLGTGDPAFVEVGATDRESRTTYLSATLAWRGVAARSLDDVVISGGLDLLVVPDDARRAWDQFAAKVDSARVVVIADPPNGIGAGAKILPGYAFIGTTAAKTSAFFVRDDLALLAGFAVL